MRWWLKIRKRGALDRDLHEEIAFHQAMRARDREQSENEIPAFGNETQIREELHDMWTFVSIENAWRDVYYALRGLRRNPAFTVVAILTLAIGIGANTAVGVPPMLGRWFTQAEDTPGTQEAAILSYGYWQHRFGGDESAIGRTITVDSRSREVIGVMPQGFRFLDSDPEVILPQRFEGDQLRPNDVHSYTGIARLKPGVTLAQASRDVARMLPIWVEQYGTSPKLLEAAHFAPALRPLREDVVGDITSLL
jgi:MacB-like periplasmic core domain